jgi:excisionase family DNA binding protein
VVRNGRRELLTVGQACRYVGVSRMTLLAAEDAGLLMPARTPGGHRRYERLDLDRLLVRRGSTTPPDPQPTPPLADREQRDPVLAEALRQLVLLLRADAAALYEVTDDALVLRRSFGLPRWLIDQLTQRPAPEPVLQALATGREVHFEAADCFPRPSSGAGFAVPVPDGDQPLGVLAVLAGRGRSFLGGELDIIRATATCLNLMLEQQRLVDALSARLREVHRLTTKETINV